MAKVGTRAKIGCVAWHPKQNLIATITANANNIFSKEQLAVKTVGELRGIAALCGSGQQSSAPAPFAPQLYFGAGGVTQPVTQNTAVPPAEEGLDLPVMNFGSNDDKSAA